MNLKIFGIRFYMYLSNPNEHTFIYTFVNLYERTLLGDRKIVLETYGGTISILTPCIQKRNIQKNHKLTNIQSRELNVLLLFDTKWKM